MQYRREIDGLRAFAVLPVIFFHAGVSGFGGGFVGVDIFFVISGYLITSIILLEIKKNSFSILGFYERRARRILPALFLMMLVCLPFSWFLMLPQDLVSVSKSLMSVSVFGSNVFFWSERGYFGVASDYKPLIHTWSLAVEEQYYLFFPLFLLFFAKKDRYFSFLLWGGFLGSFALCVLLTRLHQDTAFFLLPTRLWELLVGSILAVVMFKRGEEGRFLDKPLSVFFEIFGFALILGSIFLYDKNTAFPGEAALAPVFGAALVICGASSVSPIGRMLGMRIFVFVGLLSYSAYLWHQPVFSFIKHYGGALSGWQAVLVVVLVFAVSFVSWKYVEQPCRRAICSRKVVFISSALGLSFFFVVGYMGVRGNGFLDRYDERDALVFRDVIDAGSYVSARFDKLQLVPFTEASVKKVVVIGDSYGKDLVNAIHEGGLSDHVQVSTYQINSECGNLYLDYDFTSHIDSSKLPRCLALGWYEKEALRDRIREADAVWLASSWSLWVAELLPQSVDNLIRDFGKPVFIFGTKNFGTVTAKSLISVPYDLRHDFQEEIDPVSRKIQMVMRGNLAEKNFIDVSALMCGDKVSSCKIFNKYGAPLTFDGGHLTKSGAELLGRALSKDVRVLNFIK